MADENIVIKINMDSKDFDGGADKVEEQLRGIGSAGEVAVGNMLGDAIMKASEKMLELGKEVYEVGTAFEKTFAKVTTLTGPDVAISDLRQNVIGLSNVTGVAADSLNEGLYQALSAGVKITGDGSDALKFLNTNVKLTEGGFTDMATAVDTTTTVINAYGMAQEDVTKVSDILISTQNEGKTTVAQLGAVMGQVVPTAANLGVSFEQVGATMAAMTAQGIPTAQAATQLRQALVELSKSGQVASDAFLEAAGVSFPEFIEKGGTMQEAMQLMAQYAEKSGLRINDLFGSVEAANTALVLASDTGSAKFVKSLDTMNNSAGATDDAFAKMTNTVGYKLDKAFNKMKNSAIKVFDGLAPGIELVANIIGALGDALNAMPKPMADFVAGFGAVIAVAGPAVLAIGLIKKAIQSLGIAINTALPIIAAIGLVVGAITAAVGVLNDFDSETQKLKDSSDQLVATVKDANAAYDDNAAKLEAQANIANGLVDKLDSVRNSSMGAEEKQKELASVVAQLNSTMPELNIVLGENGELIDGNTGKTIENTAAIKERISQIEKEAKAEAKKAHLVDLYKNLSDVQTQMDANNKKINSSQKLLNETFGESTPQLIQGALARGSLNEELTQASNATRELGDANKDLAKSEADIQSKIDVLTQDISAEELATITNTEAKEENTAATQEQTAAQSELAAAIQDGTTKVVEAYGQEIAVSQEAADEFQKAMDSRVESVTGGFDKLSKKQRESVAELTKSIQKETENLRNYNDNLVLLKGSKIDPNFLQQIVDMGDKGSDILATLADEFREGGDAVFDELNASFADGSAEAARSAALGIDGAVPLVKDAAGNLVNAVTGEIAVLPTQAAQAGAAATTAAATAITSTTPLLSGAAHALADAATSAWTPVPEQYRQYAQGAANGVVESLTANIPLVEGAAYGIYDAATGQMIALPSQYATYGAQAATMFANGEAAQIPVVEGSTMQLYDAATGALIPLPAELESLMSQAGNAVVSNVDSTSAQVQASMENIDSSMKGGASNVKTSYGEYGTAATNAGQTVKTANDGMASATDKAAQDMQTAFGNAATQMGTDAERIKQALQSVVDSINDVNSQTIKINVDQDIKLPHFSMSGAFNAQTGSVPSVDVRWYKKCGIFYEPTIAGFGDVPEAAVPLDKLVPLLSAAWKEVMQDQQAVAGLKAVAMEAIEETNTIVSRKPSIVIEGEMKRLTGSGYGAINVSIPITVNGKMTDKEIEDMTDKMEYAIRKKIGRLLH